MPAMLIMHMGRRRSGLRGRVILGVTVIVPMTVIVRMAVAVRVIMVRMIVM